MSRFGIFGLMMAAALMLFPTSAARTAGDVVEKKQEKDKPQIEVVFCLDTTGSMGGLLDGAKEKIWSICNQIVSGKPTPQVKVGLVAFRDRGSAEKYVTQVHAMTSDLDEVHKILKTFNADGGGDEPESVNQALHESVTKIKWSEDNKTLKLIFLVGDAPPHTDYKDDVQYPETCVLACKKGIIINTIQCGNNANCATAWKDICVKAEGAYVQIGQKGDVVAIATPFDKRLSEINGELSKTTVAFGDGRRMKEAEEAKKDVQGLAPAAAADRVAFNAKAERNSAFDLLDAVKNKTVKLEDLKDEQLPKELKGKNLKEKQAYLEKIEKNRIDLNKEALDLDKKRNEFIAKEREKLKLKSGFDGQVIEMLRKQAKKVNVEYK